MSEHVASAIRLTVADIGKPGLVEWLRAHDLDPGRTMPDVVISDGRVEATLYVLDDQGRKQLDRDGPAGVVVELVEVPLRTALPPHLGTEIR